MCFVQVVLAYGAESDRKLNIPGEVHHVHSKQLTRDSTCQGSYFKKACQHHQPYDRQQLPLCPHEVQAVHQEGVPFAMQEDSKGVCAAQGVCVGGSNGHPDPRELPIELSRVEAVGVCGIGQRGPGLRRGCC